MNKPLTVEELKALKVGDWIWVINKDINKGIYVEVVESYDCATKTSKSIFIGRNYYVYPNYLTYGYKWVAYKNKEQAEGGREDR